MHKRINTSLMRIINRIYSYKKAHSCQSVQRHGILKYTVWEQSMSSHTTTNVGRPLIGWDPPYLMVIGGPADPANPMPPAPQAPPLLHRLGWRGSRPECGRSVPNPHCGALPAATHTHTHTHTCFTTRCTIIVGDCQRQHTHIFFFCYLDFIEFFCERQWYWTTIQVQGLVSARQHSFCTSYYCDIHYSISIHILT